MLDQVSARPTNINETAMTERTSSKISVRISATPLSLFARIQLLVSISCACLLQSRRQKIVQHVAGYRLGAGVPTRRAGQLPGIENVARSNIQQSFGFSLRLARLQVQVLRLHGQRHGHVDDKRLSDRPTVDCYRYIFGRVCKTAGPGRAIDVVKEQ